MGLSTYLVWLDGKPDHGWRMRATSGAIAKAKVWSLLEEHGVDTTDFYFHVRCVKQPAEARASDQVTLTLPLDAARSLLALLHSSPDPEPVADPLLLGAEPEALERVESHFAAALDSLSRAISDSEEAERQGTIDEVSP